MAEQQFKRDKVSILFKRAAEYIINPTDSEAVKAKKKVIHDRVLLYGEPLYLVDLDVIVVGNGVLDKHESSKETDWTVSGSTVEELINGHHYFESVDAPTFYANDIKKPSISTTPSFHDNSLNIADTEYVEIAIKERLEVFYGSTAPNVNDTQKYPIIWVDTSNTKGAHVPKIKSSADAAWVSLYDNVQLTNNSYLDVTPAVGSNNKYIANTEYVDRAILNGAEVYYGTEVPSASMTFAGDNQKYPLIYVYKTTNKDGKTVETPYVFDAAGKFWNVFENLSLTGTPTAPTNSTVTDTSTQIATDAFVWNAINNKIGTLDFTELDLTPAETIDKISETDGKISVTKQSIKITYDQVTDGTTNKKPLPGNNVPKMDSGSGSKGADATTAYSREDHVHPTDTSREAVGNKITAWNITASTTAYPCEKLVKDYVDAGAVKKTKNTSDTLYVIGVKNDSRADSVTSGLQYNLSGGNNSNGVRINCSKGVLMGAAWNDFAEFRKCVYDNPGTVVCETGKGDLVMSGEKLQAGASVITDTYGMIVGPEEDGYQPVAVAGRVLVYYTGEPTDYKPGAAVCAGPFGRILPMDRDDIKNYPDRILGYVSEIPTYEEWNGVKVNNRIWIKIK